MPAASASNWAEGQREGWLCKLYGQNGDDGVRRLSASSPQSQLVEILEKLLSRTSSPIESAASTTVVVLQSRTNVKGLFSNLVGLYFSAVESVTEEDSAQLLVDYLIALAHLPDAVDPGPSTIYDYQSSRRSKPGDIYAWDGETLWRDLPSFNWNLTERFQGPEAYTHDLVSPATPEAAAESWKRINTWVALLATSEEAQQFPALAGKINLGLRALHMGLENPSTSDARMHAPAVLEWFRVAGADIERLCAQGTEWVHAGDLWRGQGGSNVCNAARLRFWKARIHELSSEGSN